MINIDIINITANNILLVNIIINIYNIYLYCQYFFIVIYFTKILGDVFTKEILMSEINLGNKIKILRTEVKMNQKEFAEKIGIKQSTLSSYENGNAYPSNEVLLTIAKDFNVSLDWLFGLSQSKSNISTVGDIADFLMQMDEIKELRFELDINNRLPNDMEDEENKWTASVKFYGNDNEHSMNADMCNFLGSFEENRNSLESYFTSKELYDIWKEKEVKYYSTLPLTKKAHEELDNTTRLKKRNELLEKQFKEKNENK